jgi:hypothetical protein
VVPLRLGLSRKGVQQLLELLIYVAHTHRARLTERECVFDSVAGRACVRVAVAV